MHRNCTGTALELHWNVNSNWIQHKSQFMRHYLRIWWVVIDAVIWWRRNASLYEFHFLLLKIIFLPLLLRSCCLRRLRRLRRWLQVSPGDKLLQSNVSLVIIPSDLLKNVQLSIASAGSNSDIRISARGQSVVQISHWIFFPFDLTNDSWNRWNEKLSIAFRRSPKADMNCWKEENILIYQISVKDAAYYVCPFVLPIATCILNDVKIVNLNI